MKKILVSDYDSTLYTKNDDDMRINIEKIKKFRNKGNLFAIATARSYLSLGNQISKYNFEYDYLILNHGSIILDRNHNVIKYYELGENIVRKIIKYINTEDYTIYSIFEEGKLSITPITKLRIECNTFEKARSVKEDINTKFSKYVVAFIVRGTCVDIVSNNTNKCIAIDQILQTENTKINDVYTIGDGETDFEMIKKYNGCGMADSEPIIKEVAKKLYKNVYELIDEII